MRLNLDKTVVIPLWWVAGEDSDMVSAKAALIAICDLILREHPEWSEATFSWQGCHWVVTTRPWFLIMAGMSLLAVLSKLFGCQPLVRAGTLLPAIGRVAVCT